MTLKHEIDTDGDVKRLRELIGLLGRAVGLLQEAEVIGRRMDTGMPPYEKSVSGQTRRWRERVQDAEARAIARVVTNYEGEE